MQSTKPHRWLITSNSRCYALDNIQVAEMLFGYFITLISSPNNKLNIRNEKEDSLTGCGMNLQSY
ncbi:MAG: hypothetical protein ACJ71R_21715 [Nitrososphaeraceae archaeon]